MKKLYSLVAAMFLAGNMFAATDVYLSATGDDANAGTKAAPVATLAKAYELAEEGATIHVSGMINVTEMLDNADGGKNHLYFLGTSAETDGFDGQNASAILRLWNKNTTVEKLSFKNAYKEGNGAAINAGGGTLTVKDCVFTKCVASGDGCNGGAVQTSNATVTLTNCDFTECEGNEGGAMDVRGGTVNINGCNVYNNHAKSNGAIDCVDINVNMTNTKVYNNVTDGTAGAMRICGGGARSVEILQSAIVGNTSGDHAGGIHFILDGGTTQNIVFAGTTVAENSCNARGGAIWFDGSSNENTSVKFINCTIYKNNNRGANAGNCGGISFWSFPCSIEFDNCILAGSTSKDQAYGDILPQKSTIVTKNCFIESLVPWDGDGNDNVVARFQENATNCVIGVEDIKATGHGLGSMDEEGLYYPVFFLEQTVTMGDPALAAGYKDQLGAEIGKVIGAVQTLNTNVSQGMVIPGVVDCTKYDLGGQGNAWDSWGNGTPTGGTDHLGWSNGGSWVNYTIDVKQAGVYDVECHVEGAGSSSHFDMYKGDVKLGTFSTTLPGWGNGWFDVEQKEFVTLEEGVQIFTLKGFAEINVATMKFTLNEVATGINTVAPVKADNKWYNLQGVEVAQPTKGIFIHNGKKVLF